MKIKLPFLILIVGLTAWNVPQLIAGNDRLLDILRENRTITEEEYQSLKSESRNSMETTFDNGIKIESRDGNFVFKPGGQFMIDAAIFNNDKTDLGDGANVDQARLSLEGVVYRKWEFELEIDFAENDPEIKDSWIGYEFGDGLRLKLGYFKEPFSLEELTSAKHLTFMERALPNVFVPGRHLGISVAANGKHWTAVSGFFGENIEPGVSANEDDEGYGVSGRITLAPILEESKLLHFGLNLAWRTPDHELNNRLDFDAGPESDVTNRELVNTGNIINVHSFTTQGVEIAVVWGSFSLQGEYLATQVIRDRGARDVSFDGAYIFGSWFLTGESRNYKSKDGSFGRVKPLVNAGENGGWGAWELGCRYSTVDLNDNGLGQNRGGGQEDNITYGINWYLNPMVRFMINYIMVDSKRRGINDDPEILQIRVQFVF